MSLRSQKPTAPPNHEAIVTYRHNTDARDAYETRVARHIAFFVLGVADNANVFETISTLDPQKIEELTEKRRRMQTIQAVQDHLNVLQWCISELLTNADLYGNQFQELVIGLGSMAVEGSDDGHILILVRDKNPSWVPQKNPNHPELLLDLADDERRRGLDIAIYDAENYGYSIGEDGKTIWVEYGPEVNDSNAVA